MLVLVGEAHQLTGGITLHSRWLMALFCPSPSLDAALLGTLGLGVALRELTCKWHWHEVSVQSSKNK